MAATGVRLAVDRIVCDGSGLCAELLPELVELDDWGYPILTAAAVPPNLVPLAKRAVADCPVLALRLEPIRNGAPAALTPGARPRRT